MSTYTYVYKIAYTETSDGFGFVRDPYVIDEDIFYNVLAAKIRELTIEKPEEYDKVLDQAITNVQTNKPLSIANIWFKIEKRKK